MTAVDAAYTEESPVRPHCNLDRIAVVTGRGPLHQTLCAPIGAIPEKLLVHPDVEDDGKLI